VWHNSFIDYHTKRPQHQANGNLSAFFNTGSIGHELKFGFGWRQNGIQSVSQWPGQGNVGYLYGPGYGAAKLTRPKNVAGQAVYYDAFIGDTITANNLTVNVGLRYDNQKDKNFATSDPANVAFPDLLPAISYAGTNGYAIDYKDWQPRIGLTYALGAQKTTLLRASYARFADQLGSGALQFANPIGYQYLYYQWTDANGNNRPDPGELGSFYGTYGVDPNNPSGPSPNRVNKDLKNTKTDEFMAGIDHQILPEFVAGLTYTYRHRTDFQWTPYIGITSADFTQVSPGVTAVDSHGNPVGTTGPLYAANLPDGFTFGKDLTNRPGYTTDYHSVELALTKRLSNRWMAHGSFTWTSWKQKTSSSGCQDPTNKLGANGDTCDSEIVYFGGASNSGSFGNVYINAPWAYNVAALYQLPLNFNIGANIYGRDGYPAPYYVNENPGDGLGTRKAIVGAPDDHRNPSLFQLDLRAEKVIPLFQKADLTLSMDVFNATNKHTVLQTRIRAQCSKADFSGCSSNSSTAGETFELQNSRVLRFGARLSF
jgi:hypothetical protein